MFDPYDQVRLRTQQLLASASRIRQERTLNAAGREGAADAMTTAPPSHAGPSPADVGTPVPSRSVAACPPDTRCDETVAPPESARTRAA